MQVGSLLNDDAAVYCAPEKEEVRLPSVSAKVPVSLLWICQVAVNAVEDAD
jgi:hypothetical protein